MRAHELDSASGLRPLSAFVVVAAVVVVVGMRVGHLALGGEHRPRSLKVAVERGAELAYGIEDRNGVPLAVFVETSSLVMSPRATWQAHTPERMACRIAEVLGPPWTPARLLAAMLPDARGGVIDAEALPLDRAAAERVDAWIRAEDLERFGIGLAERPDGYRVAWRPEVLLARATRAELGRTSPLQHSRWLADGLADALWGPLTEVAREPERERRRARVWAALLPAQWTKVVPEVPPAAAAALEELLRAEGVERHQMRLEPVRAREYPAGGFPVLGAWGWVEEGQREPTAYSGLERLCDRLLSGDEWSFLATEPTFYRYREERPVVGGHRGVDSYFLELVEAADPPRVRVTLDVALQRMVRARLERVMDEHRPAVALAIAVDVPTGQVLAADGLCAYGMAAFPPVKHLFMPGSTFKVVTMATALEAGAVRPGDRFDVGHGGEWVLRAGGGARVIHEAEGSAEGVLTAAECLAHSVNAGLVQIGLRVDQDLFRGKLEALGYGRLPRSGLGGEEPGSIPALPWHPRFSHASVSFGYEVLTTLWQHMQALCTVLRGGTFRPLVLADAVVAEDAVWPLAAGEERRVFSPETCASVRGMMELGARVGTGAKLFRDDIRMGTKTGTAERVPSEVCLHEFGRRVLELARAGRAPTMRDYRALAGVRSVHGRCHTSSILAFGSLPGGPTEIAVLVVVDEPTSGLHFGSQVAGPAAVDILVETLGLTRGGLTAQPELVAGFAPSLAPSGETLAGDLREQPWRVR